MNLNEASRLYQTLKSDQIENFTNNYTTFLKA